MLDTCIHFVKSEQRPALVFGFHDRMDITGARWGLDGAEAVLKLRALISNGDFDEYWRCHQAQERQTLHESRYAQAVIPQPE